MIEFATLFLFLVTGIHPVGVVVSEPVASVEIVLDGQTVGVIEGEPWTIDCDFGRDPLPHELVAIGRDESGQEVETIRQLVNLPRSRSEVRLTLVGAPEEPPAAVRLIIGSSVFVKPQQIFVELDGVPLKVDNPQFVRFPKFDSDASHVVTAEVNFSDGSAAHAAISFSHRSSGNTGTELTAVPITFDDQLEPTVESLEGFFAANGEQVGVVAVEQTGGRIVMVRDVEATLHLQRLGQFKDRRVPITRRREISRSAWLVDDHGLEEELFRTVVSIPAQIETEARSLEKSFWMSPFFRLEAAGLDWCATHIFPLPDELAGGHSKQQVADAVTVAGLQAAGSGRPRVVVLVVGDEKQDASLFGIEAAKRFLRALNVPLVVWTSEPATAERWGGGTLIRTPKQLTLASENVMHQLRSQRIVWLDGLLMPNGVVVKSGDRNVGIAR
jgi:hypothetical protein